MEQSTSFHAHDDAIARRRDNTAWRERSDQIQRGARDVVSAMDDLIVDVERSVRRQLEERPYATLSVAAGVGYVLGGGLASRLTSAALSIATRLATAVIAQEIGARLNADMQAATNKTHGGSQ